jgi:formylglycine-generating enzyme required for sulfatase activity
MCRFILCFKILVTLCLGLFIIPDGIFARPTHAIPDSLQMIHFEVNGIKFEMQRVEGGVFIMGGTREQHHEHISTDLPIHTVALDAYYIAPTEVTQALWKAVMTEWDFLEDSYSPSHPMTYITWHDCMRFIHRLDSITGIPFRLPTEAEWEFAARGGNNSQNFRFAGSNIAEEVSWGLSNAGFRIHSVGTKQANELGLYDMTGNVSEWCSDWYGPYSLGTSPNPRGPEQGNYKVIRGGSFDNCEANRYISRREYLSPQEATNYCGMRLALSLPNEPTLQTPNEATLVRKLKLKNIRIKLIYVDSITPYYITENPVTCRVWNKVMNLPNDVLWSEAIVDKTESEWMEFLEECRYLSHEALVFATDEEVQLAIENGVTQEPKIKKNKQRRWEKNTRSIQRHRKVAKKAQKWADLIGVQIKTTDDPTLQLYSPKKQTSQPRWLVIKKK